MLLFANIIGWIVANKHMLIVGGALVIVLIAVLVGFNRCKKPIKMDEAQIQAAQKAIAEQDRKVMEKVFIDSEVQQQEIDETVADASTKKVNADAEAHEKVKTMSNEDLARILNERSQ